MSGLLAGESSGTVTARRHRLLTLSLFALSFVVSDVSAAGPRPGGEADAAEALRLGERIYREGILSSGESVQAVVQGDTPVDGRAFTCVSCHLRSGLGSFEGRVTTPATDGRSLYRPLASSFKGVQNVADPPLRPAYTDETLADAILEGVDPSGRTFDDIMPRYRLNPPDLAILIAYLKSLSSAASPGVDATTIRFAAVVADDADPAVAEALLGPLERYLELKNTNAPRYGWSPRRPARAASMVGSRGVAATRFTLARWPVHGPRTGWRNQLEEHYRREPVFALLGGVSGGDWRPVHDFCEANRIPALFPLTPFPVISETDWYTLYVSKGYQQEGEAAARYIAGAGPAGDAPVQVLRDTPAARALAEGFDRVWRERGHEPPPRLVLGADEELTGARLKEVLERGRVSALLLWASANALPALGELAAAAPRPAVVVLSASDLGAALWSLPEGARPFTFVAYPWRLPQDELRAATSPRPLAAPAATDPQQRAAGLALTISEILSQAFMEWRGAYVRDRLLEVIGMMADRTPPYFERLSFGPDQRYASKGCYIVQLSGGPRPELVRKSDWVTH